MAEGNYRSRLPLDTADEIGQVAAEFNHMADKLEESRLQEESIHTLKRELITNVSHDLRGPLTSIQGYVEALEDGLAKDTDTIRRYAGTIRKKSTQLSQLVDDLLLYSRLESGHIPLSTVQEDAADWFRQSLAEVEPDIARAGLTLEADIPNSGGIVTIDVHKMQQVVTNLVQNTLRYALGGGRLTAGLETVDNSVRFMLADDGPGLQTADIPHLFERFYQGRNQAEGVGAGLGLAIAAQLVNAHGGQIWAENKSDGGDYSPPPGHSTFMGLPCGSY
jgi:signal transduction histidine kinase